MRPVWAALTDERGRHRGIGDVSNSEPSTARRCAAASWAALDDTNSHGVCASATCFFRSSTRLSAKVLRIGRSPPAASARAP